jgi:hypothetical protein
MRNKIAFPRFLERAIAYLRGPRSNAAAPMNGAALVRSVEETLSRCNFDFRREIADLGQVVLYEQRESGYTFTIKEHIRALILAQLSNQRPWGPIAANNAKIDAIFGQYDPNFLTDADPAKLSNQICAIKCGNRQIAKQMALLRQNIHTLQRIEHEFGSLDSFVSGRDPLIIAREISIGKKYKLQQVGFALAMEYLKNVGIRATKPDVHILRLLGPRRLGYLVDADEEKASVLVTKLAVEAKVSSVYMDNLLWLFCAKNYADICGAYPRCHLCLMKSNCRYTAIEAFLTEEN